MEIRKRMSVVAEPHRLGGGGGGVGESGLGRGRGWGSHGLGGVHAGGDGVTPGAVGEGLLGRHLQMQEIDFVCLRKHLV